MRMRAAAHSPNRDPFHRAPHHARQIQYAQQNQHESHRQFHAQAKPRRNRELEQNNRGANQENRNRVSQSPKRANHRGVKYVALAADDRGDGNDVIGIGSVAHPQKKSQQSDGEQSDHLMFPASPVNETLASEEASYSILT